MKSLKVISVAAIAILVAGTAAAAPIALPDLSVVAGGTPVAGQSRLTSFPSGPGDFVNIDWIVTRGDFQIPDGMGGFLVDIPFAFNTDATDFVYMYQVENDSTTIPTGGASPTEVDLLTISGWDTSLFVPIGGAQYIPGVDLDDTNLSNPGHNALDNGGLFSNLGAGTAETEPSGTSGVACGVGCGSVGPTSLTWSHELTPINFDTEGDGIYFFVTKQPPVYGPAQVTDGATPSPWGSDAPDGQNVPIPGVPEPGTVLLLGLGLGLLGLRSRKQRKQ